MSETCDVTLATGLWREGRCHRSVRLEVPGAEARCRLVDEVGDLLPAHRVTRLLAATVSEIGDVRQLDADGARMLAIGDRDRIALALRKRLFGDDLECVCSCACGEALELTVPADALIGAGGEPAPQEAEASSEAGRTVRVRIVTGADHERAAELALMDVEAAERALVERCVVEARATDGSTAPADDDVLACASSLLEDLDPRAEIVLRGTCPGCDGEVAALLDPGAYLWEELERWRRRLELDVHVLASVYHWTEADIVALEPARRERYIELIDRFVAVP